MKRILCTSNVLMMLLTACSAPVQQLPPSTKLNGEGTYGVYELDFHVERLSGCDRRQKLLCRWGVVTIRGNS